MKQTIKAQCSKDAERKHKELMCKVRIGAELARAVLVYFEEEELPNREAIDLESKIIGLAYKFQKVGK